MINMKDDHEQYNLEAPIETPPAPTGDTPNVQRIDKDLNIKNFYQFNDNESINRRGQKFRRSAFSTVLLGSVYSVASSEFLIGITNLSYAPSVGLPKPSLVGEGKHYIVKDEAGGAGTTTITIRSDGEKTIDGATTLTITTNYGAKELYNDGNNWFTK